MSPKTLPLSAPLNQVEPIIGVHPDGNTKPIAWMTYSGLGAHLLYIDCARCTYRTATLEYFQRHYDEKHKPAPAPKIYILTGYVDHEGENILLVTEDLAQAQSHPSTLYPRTKFLHDAYCIYEGVLGQPLEDTNPILENRVRNDWARYNGYGLQGWQKW